ncbi:nucleotidyltransferase [Clostridium sp. A1-XYC3]|uniref:tRNA(Met) cytidine acetate ligase n=1 Tax=Clostridium tanneri TaxID=3037988 RepID=A0ABU4JSD8_9CLOT|nr:nucleotidyltransferase [Clostridium sp. A1-XYC3]MDW8801064.1 nucleotidyltransferase [Clostridium sp. A1-XYC3]
MKVTGVIVEYNPFHKGHLYHLEKTKEITNCDGIIAVMSGSFMQRGIPAMVDKWNRAKSALLNGVDLVIELPTIYSLSSAEIFAYGGISLLDSLGVTNCICFGSEYGDAAGLSQIASILLSEPEEYRIILKNQLNLGLSFPVARSRALIQFLQLSDNKDLSDLQQILSSSNNILGIEYCKSILKLNSNIEPFSIKRQGGSYTSTALSNTFSSASSIRKYIKENKSLSGLQNHLPEKVYDSLLFLLKNNYNFVSEDSMLPYIKYKTILHRNLIKNLPDVSEGIDNRIVKFLETANSYEELISLVKSKRYTYTRISRILCQYFVGFENFDTDLLRKRPCPYARVLGFNSTGLKILKEAKRKSSIPIYTKLPKTLDDTLKLDILATRFYSLLNNSIHPNSDYLTSPIITS